MDYEKKQRLIALRDSMKSYGYMDGVEELESIFPELVESENERIRKEIISALKYANDGGVYDKHIDYLEKQKEQKSVECNKCAMFLSGECTRPNGKCKNINPKQEWSEEDEETIRNAINRIEQLDHYWNRPRDEKLIKRLKSLRPSWQIAYRQIVHSIFKMLEGKDFRRMPSRCVSLLNDIRVKCKDAIECAPILDEPSWKPNEEQMEALQRAIDACESEWVYQDDELRSLFTDLEKLMQG